MAITVANVVWMCSVFAVMVVFIVTALVGASKPDAPEDDE